MPAPSRKKRNKFGRHSRYTPSNVERIIMAIRQTGTDEAGWIAGGISKETFNRWRRDHDDFHNAVEEARENFKDYSPQAIRFRLIENINKAVIRGGVESVRVHQELITDKNGETIRKKTSKTTFTGPLLPWMANIVNGKPIAILDAMQLLLAEGIATPQQAAALEKGIEDLYKNLRNLEPVNYGALEELNSAFEEDELLSSLEDPQSDEG
jgi:chromosome segregation ATPase